jgi:hypothetical protein
MKALPTSVSRFKKRAHRCYELCALAMIRDNDAKSQGWILVHGVKQGFPHAWIVSPTDGLIYDGVAHAWTYQSLYERDASVERCYSYEEAMAMLAMHHQYGPWHEKIAAA